jgi:FeS assembly SUF system regulator
MIKIGKIADYALIIMAHMAANKGKLRNSNDIAEATHVAMPTVSKILKLLVGGGLLESVRGKNGGYLLNKSGNNISVVEVIEAIDGPISITDCVTELHDCGMKNLCGMQSGWQKVNVKIKNTLEDVKVSDFINLGEL